MLGQWGQDPLQGNPRYTSIRTLNHSGRTLLQLALDRSTGEKVAIKFTQRGWDEGQSKYLLRELLIHQELSACHHPHIVELRDVFLTPLHLAAVHEYVEGEDLQTFLTNTGGRVSEALGRFLFQQLVLALDFCHARGKVSRGVKLANTLLALSPGQLPLVKLADFGFSKDSGRHSAPSSQVGTALFVPPEVMHNFNQAPYDGALVDVWACGIVLFMLLFGRHPCLRPEDSGLSEQQQMLALFTRTAASQFCLLPEEAAAISPACADLLGHMLQTQPKLRYTMSQIQAHPWFKQGLPEGAGLMNATILAEASARPLTLRHSPEALAAFVRHGQKLDHHLMSSRFGSSQAAAAGAGGIGSGGGAASSPAVNIPNSPPNSRDAAAAAAAGRSGGSAIAARVASSTAAAAASMDEDHHMPWGGPPPARLLIHSCSSNDKATGLQYKQQEEQLLRSGVVPPARFHMSESMSSSHGSFIAQQQVQRQQQQQQQELATLLESIPSAGLCEDALAAGSPAQQQQQQFNIWMPQQGPQAHPLSSSTTSGAGAVAGASPGPAGPGGMIHGEVHSRPSGVHGGVHSGQGGSVCSGGSAGGPVSSGLQQQVQQQQAQLQALQLQQRQQQEMFGQQQQHQQQQRGGPSPAAVAMNGGAGTSAVRNISLLNSADLEALLPMDGGAAAAAQQQQQLQAPSGLINNSSPQQQQQQQQQQYGSAPAAAAGAAVGVQQMEQQNSFMLMLEGINSLPTPLDGSLIDSLLNPAANPLLNEPMPAQYAAQQQQLQQQQQPQGSSGGRSAGGVGAGAAAAASPAGAVSPASSYQQQQQGGGGDDNGGLEIPEDYAAFLVDKDDLAAVRGEGAEGQRKRVLSGAGAGISSCSLDLRKLSDLLMGGSSVQLFEDSAWHKLCRDSFTRAAGGVGGGVGGVGGGVRSGPAALGGGGGDPLTSAAHGGGGGRDEEGDEAGTGGCGNGVDDEDDLHELLGLRDMSITR